MCFFICQKKSVDFRNKDNKPQLRYARLQIAAVAQPKSTEVPDYPHNYHTIPMFVHRIGLPLAIHWQHSFVQKTTKVCAESYIHRTISMTTLLCMTTLAVWPFFTKKSDVAGIPTTRRCISHYISRQLMTSSQ